MKFFSSKGEKSTPLERSLFVGAILAAAVFVAPGIHETVQVQSVLSHANPALQDRCAKESNYSAWRVWNTRFQIYATCIVEAKDPAVQHAAGKYLLQGKEGTFEIAPQPPTPAVSAP